MSLPRFILIRCSECLTPQFHGRILSLIIRRMSSTDICTAISPVCSSRALSGDTDSRRIILVNDLREIDLRLIVIIRDNIRLRNWGFIPYNYYYYIMRDGSLLVVNRGTISSFLVPMYNTWTFCTCVLEYGAWSALQMR